MTSVRQSAQSTRQSGNDGDDLARSDSTKIESDVRRLHKDGGDLDFLRAIGGVTGLAKELDVRLKGGVKHSSIEMRQKIFGKNRIPEKPAQWYIHHLWKAFQDKTMQLLCLLAIAQAIVSLATESEDFAWIQGVAVLYAVGFIVGVRALLMAYQEQALRRQHVEIATSYLIVLRDGAIVHVSMFNLVVGDIVYLQAGEQLKADGVLLPGCSDVVIDESQLLGAAYDTKKNADDAPFLFAGTSIKSGTGKYLVTAVGVHTASGKAIARQRGVIADKGGEEGDVKVYVEVPEEDQLDNTLRKKLDNLVAAVAVFAFGMAGLATFVGLGYLICGEYLIEGREFNAETDFDKILQAMIMGMIIVVVAFPKHLPLAASFCLSASMRRMRKHAALVKCMQAAGTIGRATAVCISKSGMLTQSKMQVAKVFIGSGSGKLCLDGTGQERSQGSSTSNVCSQLFGSALSEQRLQKDVHRLIHDNIVLTKDAFANVKWTKGSCDYEGNKIDCALLHFLAESGASIDMPVEDLKKYPFEPSRKRSGRAIPLPNGGCRLHMKGAAESIVKLCTSQGLPDGSKIRLDSQSRAGILADVDTIAKQCMTPIALAYRDFESAPSWNEELHMHIGVDEPVFLPETSLTFLGLFGIHDSEPIRVSVKQAVQDCSTAGMDLRMVTGDHKETSIAIAKEAGVLRTGIDYDEKGKMHPFTALTGEEFRRQVLDRGSLNQAAFDEVWPVLRLLARSTPEDKRILVQGLQSSRLFKKEAGKKLNVYPDPQVVAITGYGSNDATVLKNADVGFAMAAGSQTAQDAAGILLMEEGLSLVVDLCTWGRNVYDAIGKFIQFQLTINIAAVTITVIGAVVAEGSMPISVLQMLWASLIMDSFGAVAFASEFPDQELLTCIPQGRKSGLMSYEMKCNIACQCVYQIVVLMVLTFAAAGLGCSPEDSLECWEKGGALNMASGLGRGHHAKPTQHFTLVFNAFICMQLFNWINCRKVHHEINVFKDIGRNRAFVIIWPVCMALQVIIVQVPGLVGGPTGDYLAQALHTAPLDWHHWLICLVVGIFSLILQAVVSVVGQKLKPSLVGGESYKPGIKLDGLPIPVHTMALRSKALAVEDMPLMAEAHAREEEQPLLQELQVAESKGTCMPTSRSLGANQYTSLRDNEQIPPPVIEFLPPGHKGLARSGDFVQEPVGTYCLEASDGCFRGEYTFDPDTRQLHKLDKLNGQLIGTFLCEPISSTPLPFLQPGSGNCDCPCIRVGDSDVMAQIQLPANEGAHFVLPSKLNGIAYPSHDGVVDVIERYKADNGVGPRGQLAVHPAAGQFLLDNAESERRPQGINAMDGILEALRLEGFDDFRCKNGYLQIPRLEDPRQRDRALIIIRQHLHKLRILEMRGVLANGLAPDKTSLSKEARHKVSLMYASAIAVQATWYGVDASHEAFQKQVADELLLAQYYGALRLAAQPHGDQQPGCVKVFFMPVGGGTYSNSLESVASSISRAVEMLDEEERAKLDIHVLTWSGNPKEREVMTELLLRHRKLKATQEPAPGFGARAGGSSGSAAPASSEPHLVQTPPLADKQRAASPVMNGAPEALQALNSGFMADISTRKRQVTPPEERMANYRLQWSFEDPGSAVQPLGLEIKWGDSRTLLPTVGELKPGQKAAKHGMMPGDIVVEVNSIPTLGMQKAELLPLLQTRPLLLQVERQRYEANIRWAYLELNIGISQGPSGQSGIEIDASGTSCVVVWVWPGTPAYAAGVMAGDALTAINNVQLQKIPKQKVPALMEASQLLLTLHRRPYSDHPVPESRRRAGALPATSSAQR
mmetsp:Transcript_15218/g.27060  ORF Transcript_15218/g.27060 Transcript_15218/m.27060 type:complete len:1806 (-) Transcript_15218:62-5479(-)